MFDWLPNTETPPSRQLLPMALPPFFGTINNRWLTTATGRLGYAWDRVLLYGKGGGAWVATNSPAISIGWRPGKLHQRQQHHRVSAGPPGFGLEWAFWNNWSVRAEYDYIGLPSQSFTVAPGPTIFGGDVITFNNRSLSIMTAAINYKFGW